MSGQMIAGRYRLMRLVGSGGFGEVWRAQDVELGIEVALKRIKVEAAAGAEERAKTVEAARAEARFAAALLFHPHIVAVTNVVVEGDVPWLAMRFVEGRSLADALQSGPLPVAQVSRIAVALLSALDAAHRLGITHRDVKPANVMLAEDGGVFLADFGIARRQDGTITSAFTGSVGYAAPERFNHKSFGPPNGPAGDLFSVGATLYHAVEGRPPFGEESDSVGETLHAVCYDAPEPLRRAGPLAPLIEALLSKQASDRPDVGTALAMLSRTGADLTTVAAWRSGAPTFGSELATTLADPGLVSAGKHRVKTSKQVLMAVAVVAFVVAGVAWTQFGHGGSGTTPGAAITAKTPIAPDSSAAATMSAPSTAPSTTAVTSAPVTSAPPVSAPAGVPSTASGSPAVAGGAKPGDQLGAYKKIDIPSGHGVSLGSDQLATKPTEWVGNDFYLSAGLYSELHLSGNMAFLEPGQPLTYQSCSATTLYTGGEDIGKISVGQAICIKGDGRLGLATVRKVPAVDENPRYIEIELMVWQDA